jgi:hypothetical protein
VGFTRSADGGRSWDFVSRVTNWSCPFNNKFMAALGVAPNGRLDVIWGDRSYGVPTLFAGYFGRDVAQLHYAYSLDRGATWSSDLAISPPFNPRQGYPNLSGKLGDYYTIVSFNDYAAVAYAATFNDHTEAAYSAAYDREQDVYFVRAGDCNGNGVHDSADIHAGTSSDGNGNLIPDECEYDCNDNGIADGEEIPALGDPSGDGLVGGEDLGLVESCFSGPDRYTEPTPMGCERICMWTLMIDRSDRDIDLEDFANWQLMVGASSQPYEGCIH